MSLTINKMLANSHAHGGTRSLSSVKYIVIHYTGGNGDTAKNEATYFANSNTRSAGAHYFVGQDGSVYLSVELNVIAWSVGGSKYSNTGTTGGGSYHGICTNANSVSIELCDNATKDPSKAQIEATRLLIKHIQSQCPNAKTIIRHFDVTGKNCLPLDTTEVLTPQGWKLMNELDLGEEVAQFDFKTNKISFTNFTYSVSDHFDKVLSNRGLEATADHRILTKPNSKNGTWILINDNIKITQVIKNQNDKIKGLFNIMKGLFFFCNLLFY